MTGSGFRYGRFWLQDQVARYPSLLRIRYLLSRPRPDFLVDTSSDLLIEGFPRSANTFAAWAFKLTNPGCKLAHHVHACSHVALAVSCGVPAVVLLRPPADAVQSLLVRRPEIPPAVALHRYAAFYEGVAEYAEQLVFVRFETMVGSYDRVMEAVNHRFGTMFRGFSDEIDTAHVFEAIDDANRQGHGGRINPRSVPRPHPTRERLKHGASLAGHDRGLQRAEVIHERLAALAI